MIYLTQFSQQPYIVCKSLSHLTYEESRAQGD